MSALLIATLCGLVLSRMPAAAAVYVPAENSGARRAHAIKKAMRN
jgi:hypothetical protein